MEIAILKRKIAAAAAFGDVKTLGGLGWCFRPSIPRKMIDDLATCQFICERRGIP